MFSCVIALMMAFSAPQAALQARDAKAIEAAKNTSVQRMEASLPDKPFEAWLQSVVGPQRDIHWEVNDCGEQTGNPQRDKERDFPMCAEAQVTLQGKRQLSVVLSVGTSQTGVAPGPARFFYAAIDGPGGSTKSVEKLSRLPEAVRGIH